MKRILFMLSLVLVTAAGRSHAQPSLSVGVDPVTSYVWRGLDVTGGGASLQPWVTATLGGLSLTAWGSFATLDRDRSVAGVPRSDLDEIDLTLGYSRSLGSLALSAGAIHYSYLAPGYPSEATSTYETYVGMGFPRLPFAPALTAYHDFNLGDGTYLALTGAEQLPLGRPVDLFFGVGYMDQNWRRDENGVRRAGISDVNLGAGLTFSYGRVTLAPALVYAYAPAVGAVPGNGTVWARVRLTADPVAIVR